MSQNTFSMLPPAANEHLQVMANLTADIFANGQYVEGFRDNYIGNSNYDWDVSRLIFAGETLIHHWGVWGYAMRLETIKLQVGGIGAVATHPDYRKQGVMHQAAQDSIAAMKAAGYDLSILRGRHYVKMGYARAWNYVTYRLKPAELPPAGLQKPYQPLRPEQVSEMDALYNRTHAGFPATAVRPTFRNRHPEDIGVYAWFDDNGRLEGYVRAMPAEDNPKALTCLEAAGDPSQGLATLADLFQHGDYESLAWFTLPHLHPMLQVLRRGACIVENRYFDITGWRVRIINLRSTLQKLAPLLAVRLAQSALAGWQGSLRLDGGEQQAVLRIAPGCVTVEDPAECEHTLQAGPALARLLIGSDEPDEIMRQENMRASGLAQSLAQTLFPNLHPMLSHWDEY